MKRGAILSFALLVAVLAALTSVSGGSTKFVFTWLNPNYNGQHFKNVMVLGINGQAANRAEFEDQVTAAISRPGMQVIQSYALIPRPNATPIDMAQLKNVIQGQNIDAVVAARLVKMSQKTTVISGQPIAPFPNYYNTFYGYYGAIYPIVYAPDYLQVEKTAQIETNFYSTGTGEGVLIWTGTSDSVNPKNPTKAIDALAQLIALRLQQANII